MGGQNESVGLNPCLKTSQGGQRRIAISIIELLVQDSIWYQAAILGKGNKRMSLLFYYLPIPYDTTAELPY